MNQAADAQGRSLRARLSAAPVLSEPAAAAARLAEVAPAWPAGFLDGPLRALLLGLADHSAFLWQLVARAPDRLAALVEAEPEAAPRGDPALKALPPLRLTEGHLMLGPFPIPNVEIPPLY